MKAYTFLFGFALLLCTIEAKNDWTKPCLNGICSFDVARSNTSMAATLTINGSSSSISDITSAAGWSILNCSTSTNSQTIQLVCTDENKGCNHLFEQGAENTIVRLPEDCGSGPFAWVVEHSIPSNQTLPDRSESKVRRGDGAVPQIQQLRIDGNFSNSSPNGETVNFSLVASTAPISDITDSSFSGETGDDLPIVFTNLVSTLFSDDPTCSGNDLTKTMMFSINATINLDIIYTFDVEGTLTPSSVSFFTVQTGLNGFAEALFHYDTGLIGTADSGPVVLISQDLPKLSIESIVNIEPQLAVSGEMSGDFEVNMQSTFGVHYDLDSFFSSVGSSTGVQSGYSPECIPIYFDIAPTNNAQSTFGGNLLILFTYDVTAFVVDSCTISVNLNSGLEVDVDTTIESTSFEACVAAAQPNLLNVVGSGNFFDIITDSLNQTLLDVE